MIMTAARVRLPTSRTAGVYLASAISPSPLACAFSLLNLAKIASLRASRRKVSTARRPFIVSVNCTISEAIAVRVRR